jgi:cytoskeletal protein CcmA (bactofilin family)
MIQIPKMKPTSKLAHFSKKDHSSLGRIALIFGLVLAVVFGLPAQVHAQGPSGDGKVVFGGTYQLGKGETLNGSLAVFGGTVTLEEGSNVNGAIVITGGTLDISGDVSGDVTAVGGALTLSDTAHLHGNIYTVGSSINRSPDAKIDGQVIAGTANSLDLKMPTLGKGLQNLNFSPITNAITRVSSAIFQSLALAVLALLMAMFILKPTERVVEAIDNQPVISGAFGLLTLIVAPALLVLLAITLILIPVSLIGIFVLGIAIVFGWIALGLELGHRLTTLLKVQWTPPVEAGVGTLVLSLVVNLLTVIPCIGWLAIPVLSMIGLGAVILTRFGTQTYIRPTQVPVAAAAYPGRPAVVVPASSVRTTPVVPSASGSASVYEVPETPASSSEPPASPDEENRPADPDENIPPSL